MLEIVFVSYADCVHISCVILIIDIVDSDIVEFFKPLENDAFERGNIVGTNKQN